MVVVVVVGGGGGAHVIMNTSTTKPSNICEMLVLSRTRNNWRYCLYANTILGVLVLIVVLAIFWCY